MKSDRRRVAGNDTRTSHQDAHKPQMSSALISDFSAKSRRPLHLCGLLVFSDRVHRRDAEDAEIAQRRIKSQANRCGTV